MGQFSALLKVAFHSLRYRSGGVLLTILAVGLSVFVLLGVEHVRQEARSSFASTVSGVDLIVGAKTGDINLLLLSVFRIGNATTNIDWETVEEIGAQEEVSWLVPISLGDSHRNFRVVGTTKDFFERYQFGSKQPLVFRDGAKFENHTQVVLGASVASQLAYDLGDSLIVSHGMADTSFTHHDQLPLTIVGILEESGTPVDNALFVSLETIEAIHSDEPHHGDQSTEHHESDHKDHGHHDEDEHHESDHKDHGYHDEDEHHESDHKNHGHHDEDEQHESDHKNHGYHDEDEHHEPDHKDHGHPPLGSVTALLVGLDSPIASLKMQRWINDYEEEALLAILPGVALSKLWELLGSVEDILRAISILVFISSLLGLNAMLLASMRERKTEIEILRSIGAPSTFILGLLVFESMLIVTIGIVLAVVGLLVSILLSNNILATELGVLLSPKILHSSSFLALALIYLSAVILSLMPAWQAYTLSKSMGTK